VARASGLPRKRLLPAALAQLVRYDWPGNVRQLRHLIEDLALLGTTPSLDVTDLPEAVRGARSTAVSIPVGTSLAEAERRLILRTLEAHATVKDAARVLGIGLRTLHTKLKRYGLRRRN
jgi:DNA-binding NtrC family response regulator